MPRTTACPTPWKAVFDSKKKVSKARRDLAKRFVKKPMNIYQCPCGMWHLRSRKKDG